MNTHHDRSVIDETAASLAAGTATPSQISAAYAAVDRPFDGDRSPNEDAIVAAAVESGVLQESHLDAALETALAKPVLPPLPHRRSRELIVTDTAPDGSMLMWHRAERIEDLLIYLSDGPSALPRSYRKLRPIAIRKGLVRNTGVTSGLASTSGGAQWVFELTDAGRDRLAAYDAEVSAQVSE